MKLCPFRPGDAVVYRPTDRGRGQGVMTEYGDLPPGQKCVVAEIKDGQYVVVLGHEHGPAGGIYWTEFAPAQE
jgi:hypothetical protein